jgi:hypothetical protein
VITRALTAGGLVAGAWYLSRRRLLPAAAPDRTATVSAVVPARDEARTLPDLLGSLAAQDRPVQQVIVVDDASADATATVAAEWGATVVRLEGDPPAGWAGKPYACAQGAAVATGEVLVFLDADVTLAPDAISRLLAAHDAAGGLVSVQPHHRVEQPYEQLSAMCNVVSMIGTGAFAPWPDARRAAAFGPCLTTSAVDYATAGGHRAVAGEVVDDIQLARRYRAAGLPTSCWTGGDAITFRMYPGGVGQLVEGWTKNMATGARLADPLGGLAGAWFVAACAAVGVAGVVAVLRIGSIDRTTAVVTLAGWTAVALELRWMLRRIGTFRWWTAVAHPIPVAAFIAIFARSVWATIVRRRVRWRGRSIRVDAGRAD